MFQVIYCLNLTTGLDTPLRGYSTNEFSCYSLLPANCFNLMNNSRH